MAEAARGAKRLVPVYCIAVKKIMKQNDGWRDHAFLKLFAVVLLDPNNEIRTNWYIHWYIPVYTWNDKATSIAVCDTQIYIYTSIRTAVPACIVVLVREAPRCLPRQAPLQIYAFNIEEVRTSAHHTASSVGSVASKVSKLSSEGGEEL